MYFRLFLFVTILKENQSSIMYLTLFLKSPDSLELFDDRGEGVGDDSDHDEEGEEEDENSGHDQLDIRTCHT